MHIALVRLNRSRFDLDAPMCIFIRFDLFPDQEMLQIRTGTGQDDSDSSDSDEDEEEPEHGRKRKYSDDATPSASTNEHPTLISAHQSAVITTAAST